MSRFIVDYGVVQSPDTEGLLKKVHEQGKRGWVPQGGMSVVTRWPYREFYQAMIKESTVGGWKT